MRVFKRTAVAAMTKLSGSLTSMMATIIAGASGIAYFAGGVNANTSTYLSAIRKMALTTEVLSVLSATIGTARTGPAGVESNVRGYIGGGDANSSYKDTIDAIRFDTDTSFNCVSKMNANRTNAAGISGK